MDYLEHRIDLELARDRLTDMRSAAAGSTI